MTYWLREQKTANAETDYVTSSGNLVAPIEVKAGKSGTLKSLHQFAARKKSPLCVRFDLNLPEIRCLTHSVRMEGDSVPVSFTLLSLRCIWWRHCRGFWRRFDRVHSEEVFLVLLLHRKRHKK